MLKACSLGGVGADLQPLGLTDEEIGYLSAFLDALQSSVSEGSAGVVAP